MTTTRDLPTTRLLLRGGALTAVAGLVACWALVGRHALPSWAQETGPAADAVEVTLLYTVNNLGYTGTCG